MAARKDPMVDPVKSRASFGATLVCNWVTITILLVSIGFVAEASTFKGDSAKFPTAVGIATALLALIDLIQSLRMRKGREDDHDVVPTAQKFMVGGWIALTIGLFYVVGILCGIAISAIVYFYVFARLNLFLAMMAGLGHSAFFWIAFDLLAGFRLYGGLLQ